MDHIVNQKTKTQSKETQLSQSTIANVEAEFEDTTSLELHTRTMSIIKSKLDKFVKTSCDTRSNSIASPAKVITEGRSFEFTVQKTTNDDMIDDTVVIVSMDEELEKEIR